MSLLCGNKIIRHMIKMFYIFDIVPSCSGFPSWRMGVTLHLGTYFLNNGNTNF